MSNEHLTFKDIPIDGNISEFVIRMEQHGFAKKQEFEDGYLMTGRFANREVDIYIICSPRTRIPCRVALYAPEQESWFELKDDYESLKKLFTIKYGTPTETYGFFADPYSEGDGDEFLALSSGKAVYSSYWISPKGIICVSINEKGRIKFAYEDAVNIEISEKETNDNILAEI